MDDEGPFAWRAWPIEQTTAIVDKGKKFDAVIESLRKLLAESNELFPEEQASHYEIGIEEIIENFTGAAMPEVRCSEILCLPVELQWGKATVPILCGRDAGHEGQHMVFDVLDDDQVLMWPKQ